MVLKVFPLVDGQAVYSWMLFLVSPRILNDSTLTHIFMGQSNAITSQQLLLIQLIVV